MRDSPYFQVGEWVELKLERMPELTGFYQIVNVYYGMQTTSNGDKHLCFAYLLGGIDDKLFHGSCLFKLFDPATQSFDEIMKDLLSRGG